jgi:lipooligosaccharide transport system ATP-binding protein
LSTTSPIDSLAVSAAPAAARAPAIRLRDVVKRFGHVTAVDHLDLEVPTGTCFGLLGPNGAGKSTTMRMLTGQAIADSGAVEVLGYRLPAESKLARVRTGVCPQEGNLDIDLTVREVLEVFARLCRVPAPDRAAAIDRALALAGLEHRADDRTVSLSGGMQRRLLIARALIHQPELLLLDEPTVGLDPQIRQELWSLISVLRERGHTVLMSTHYIEEAERLADRVAIMSRGRVVAEGSPPELVRTHAGREALDVYGPQDRLAELQAQASREGLTSRRSGPALTILHAETLDGRFAGGQLRRASLEDVFVLLTGEYVE